MDSQHEKRRLTTILAADVVGYSRLMAADEAGTYARLKAHRRELIEPKTAEYHGRVVKLMGDGTLMEFGSVVDAVNFASDAQQAMLERNAEIPEERHIRYRVGINIGDIIVDGEDIGTLSGWCPGHPKVRRAATPTRGSRPSLCNGAARRGNIPPAERSFAYAAVNFRPGETPCAPAPSSRSF